LSDDTSRACSNFFLATGLFPSGTITVQLFTHCFKLLRSICGSFIIIKYVENSYLTFGNSCSRAH
jgi:hypothetical protein